LIPSVITTILIFGFAYYGWRSHKNQPQHAHNKSIRQGILERLNYETARVGPKIPAATALGIKTLIAEIYRSTKPRSAYYAASEARNLNAAIRLLVRLISVNEFFGAKAPAGVKESHSPFVIPDRFHRTTGVVFAGNYYGAGEEVIIHCVDPLIPILVGDAEFAIHLQVNGNKTLSLSLEGNPSEPLVVMEHTFQPSGELGQLVDHAFRRPLELRFLDSIACPSNNGKVLRARYVPGTGVDALILLISVEQPFSVQ
jgi:hypothetical protein